MKLKEIKNKGFKIIFLLFALSFVADLASTLKVGALVKYLEANPFYNYGGLAIPILLNIFSLIMYYYLYHKLKPLGRFLLISSMVSMLFIRVPVIISNFQIAAIPQTPEVIEAAKQVTQQVKDAAYLKLALNYIFYLINPVITYLFFKLDHNIKRGDNDETIQN
jgi:hypothetical protein